MRESAVCGVLESYLSRGIMWSRDRGRCGHVVLDYYEMVVVIGRYLTEIVSDRSISVIIVLSFY